MWNLTPYPGKSQSEPHGMSGRAARGGAALYQARRYRSGSRMPGGYQVGTRWVQWVPDGYQVGACRRVQTGLSYPTRLACPILCQFGQSDRSVRQVGRSDRSVRQVGQTCQKCYGNFDKVKISALRNILVSGLGTGSQPGKFNALRMSLRHVQNGCQNVDFVESIRLRIASGS